MWCLEWLAALRSPACVLVPPATEQVSNHPEYFLLGLSAALAPLIPPWAARSRSNMAAVRLKHVGVLRYLREGCRKAIILRPKGAESS